MRIVSAKHAFTVSFEAFCVNRLLLFQFLLIPGVAKRNQLQYTRLNPVIFGVATYSDCESIVKNVFSLYEIPTDKRKWAVFSSDKSDKFILDFFSFLPSKCRYQSSLEWIREH